MNPRVERLGRAARSLGGGRRRPTVRVRLGLWVPGWALRVLCVVVAVACVLTADAPAILTGVVSALALVLLVRPGGALPAVLAVVVGVCALFLPTDAGVRPFLLVAGLHLVVQLGALTGRSGLSTRFELRALVPALRRYLPVQAVAQVIALLGLGLARQRLEAGWLPVLGVVVLTLVVSWLVSQLRAG